MKLWAALRDAAQGWADIVRNRPSWQDWFVFSFGGLAKGLVIFLLCAFIAIAIGSVEGGLPALGGLITNLIVQALALVALIIATVMTKLVVKSDTPLLRVLVPGLYGLAFYLLIGSILAAINVDTVVLALLALVYLLYALGRAAGGWTIGVALAFAVFAVVLLVGMPLTLYMLGSQAASPI